MTLADFLLARIAEDEAVAREAVELSGVWKAGVMLAGLSDDTPLGLDVLDTNADGDEWLVVSDSRTDILPQFDHIARHDPARVLAECEAKRRIVEWHKSWPVLAQQQPTFEPIDSADPSIFAMRASLQMAWLTEQAYRDQFGSEPPSGPILRLLALPYADRPDYDETWRP